MIPQTNGFGGSNGLMNAQPTSMLMSSMMTNQQLKTPGQLQSVPAYQQLQQYQQQHLPFYQQQQQQPQSTQSCLQQQLNHHHQQQQPAQLTPCPSASQHHLMIPPPPPAPTLHLPPSQHPPSLQQQQQHQQQPQQQVPMTTIMIPATAAAQLQAASTQIQQAAVQAGSLNQPQILVFMIPYMVPAASSNQLPPIVSSTPDQSSLMSTLVRQSHNQSLTRQQQQYYQSQLQERQQQQQQQQSQQQAQQTVSQMQQQQQQPPPPPPPPSMSNLHQQPSGSTNHSRAVSSLSVSAKLQSHEPEKFYIKANFSYQASRNKTELSFQKGDILHVIDTLQNNDYGVQYWLATRVNSNGLDADKGLIPNKSKAEALALEQRAQELGGEHGHGSTLDGGSSSNGVISGRVNFLKRRAAQRSKSFCKEGNGQENVVFDIGSFKLPTYERVVYKHPGFCRPVVIFGPLSDVAREKLLRDYPEKYSYPTDFSQSPDHPKVIRLKGVLDVVDQGKHALLDVTPSAVEKLNFVNLAPIVIFMKTDSKNIIKEFRARAAKSLDPNARDEDTLRRDGKSSKKLLEQSVKLEKSWSHVFTAVLDLSTMGSEMWYRKLRETIENQQSANVWMSEKKSDRSKSAASLVAPSTLTTASSMSNGQNALNVTNAPTTATKTTSNRNSSNNNINDNTLLSIPNNLTTHSFIDNSSLLNERFNESLQITSKSTLDLLPEENYGNRSQLRNTYAHNLAQKLARASSEPKLNGGLVMPGQDGDDDDDDDEDDGLGAKVVGVSDNHHNHRDVIGVGNDDDDDDDDDDEIIKKPPFPNEFENSSSVSSSNGATSYGQGSISGLNNMTTYQMYPPPHHQGTSNGLGCVAGGSRIQQPIQQQQQQQQANDNIYCSSRNPMLNGSSGYSSDHMLPINSNGASSTTISNSNYHPLPPMVPPLPPPLVSHQLQQQSAIETMTSGINYHLSSNHNNNGLNNQTNLNNGQSNNHHNSNTSSNNNSNNNSLTNHQQNLQLKGSNSSSNNTNNNNNIIDLARNHDTRGSAFQVYSDMNQNNYHYYNLNKI